MFCIEYATMSSTAGLGNNFQWKQIMFPAPSRVYFNNCLLWAKGRRELHSEIIGKVFWYSFKWFNMPYRNVYLVILLICSFFFLFFFFCVLETYLNLSFLACAFACYKLHPFCSQWCLCSEWNAVLCMDKNIWLSQHFTATEVCNYIQSHIIIY